MSVNHIMELLGFFLNSTCFLFQGQFHVQMEGTAMESPASPSAANLYKAAFETKALRTAENTPRIWKRCISFMVHQHAHRVLPTPQKPSRHSHKVYCRRNIIIWVYAFSGHCHHTRTKQIPDH